MIQNSLLVASGWYSAADERDDTRRRLLGDSLIRRPEFHTLWLQSVERHFYPERIVVVDSKSPTQSPLINISRVEWINLHENAGHATAAQGILSGWTQSVVFSMLAFINSGIDFYLYVEQDALVGGRNLREKVVRACGQSMAFGSGKGTPQVLQQSLFIVHRSQAQRFLTRLLSVPQLDSVLSPETKFALAGSRLPLPLLRFFSHDVTRFSQKVVAQTISRRPLRRFGWIPLSGGRIRPIAWDEDFYFQHGSSEEVSMYKEYLRNAFG